MKIHVDDAFIRSDHDIDLIESAINFFAENNGWPKTLHIIVVITPFVFANGDPGDTMAEASQISRKLFLVKFSPAIANKLLKLRFKAWEIFFHELQHVNQFLRGDMRITPIRGLTVWKGVKQIGVDYFDCPAEADAWKVGAEYATDFLTVRADKLLTKMRRGKK
jgi:hypothetical protein